MPYFSTVSVHFYGLTPARNKSVFALSVKDHLKDQDVDGRMGSKWALGILVGRYGVDSPGSG
jgi:hypothetical protein